MSNPPAVGSHALPAELPLRRKVALAFRRRRRGAGFWFSVAIDVLWWPVVVFTRQAWGGGEHVPRSGGVLIAANHVSGCDPLVDTAFVLAHGRVPRFLAKSELWSTRVIRNVMAGGRHIPVYRESARAMDAYTGAVAALKRGEVVVFFPEATFTADPAGWPMKPKNGIGRIAMTTGVPVIPLANWGTQDFVPPDGRPRFFPRNRITLVAGPPVDLAAWQGKPRTRTNLDAVTAAIMADVARLVGEIRGETPPAELFDPAQEPLTG